MVKVPVVGTYLAEQTMVRRILSGFQLVGFNRVDVSIQFRLNASDAHFCRRNPGKGQHQRGEDTDNGDCDEELDEGKRSRAFRMASHISLALDSVVYPGGCLQPCHVS